MSAVGSNIGDVCGCTQCAEAGVAQEPRRRVPDSRSGSRWIHGRELRRWLDARMRSSLSPEQQLAREAAAAEWSA